MLNNVASKSVRSVQYADLSEKGREEVIDYLKNKYNLTLEDYLYSPQENSFLMVGNVIVWFIKDWGKGND